MKKVETFPEENLMIIDDEHYATSFTFSPENKKYTCSRKLKTELDYTRHDNVVEYEISVNPIELYSRLIDWAFNTMGSGYVAKVKDGVLLESVTSEEEISVLRKAAQWDKLEILGANYDVNLYILSKHPEIISKEDYRKFLRQSVEKIKKGFLKVEKMVRENTLGLECFTDDEMRWKIWYRGDLWSTECDEYWELPEDKQEESVAGKKFKYGEKFNESLFSKSSSEYVGITKDEFTLCDEIIGYVEKLLNQKE